MKGCEGIKPGWVRVNFNYFISETAFEFLLDAVEFVAEHGWRFLPHYRFESETGGWVHRDGRPVPPRSLGDVRYDSGRLEVRTRRSTEPEWVLPSYLDAARALVDQLEAEAAVAPSELGEDFEALRWFPLPHDVARDPDSEAAQRPVGIDLTRGTRS